MRHSRLHLSAAAAFLVAAACGGCSEKITITQYPVFHDQQPKSIAVIPFRSATDPGAGVAVSDMLAASLAANGTYAVSNRNDLSALMDERDIQIAFGTDAAASAAKFKKLGKVQAILVGTVTTYAATTRNEQKSDPIFNYDNKGNQYFTGAYNSYVFTRHEANVAVSATLIRVSDGTPIHATAGPAQSNSWAQGSPPQYDANACLANATRSVVDQLVKEFAVTRCQISVKPADDLRTATELYDNKWEYADKFRKTDEKMYVVVRLPAVCDRNRFRITIVRFNERKDLAVNDIVWTSKFGSYGYMFSPKDIAAKGGGPGEYLVKFYSGPEPVMTRRFRIEPGK